MTTALKTYFNDFVKRLNFIYEINESQNIANIVFEEILKIKRHQFYFHQNISDEQKNEIENILNRLSNHEPLQYILGFTEFFGLKFMVDKNVLIPRQETEELVDIIIKDIGSWRLETKSKINILDIGTGSGCIAISLKKKLLFANVFATDISEEALKVATENAEINDAGITFILDDILNSKLENSTLKFDIIISNPPYITEIEKPEMSKNVLNFEPGKALFVPDDEPLKFYKAIINFSKNNLIANGKIFFEINESFGEEVKSILENEGFIDIQIINDLQQKQRFLKAIK